MPIISAPQDFHVEDLYVALEGLLGRALHLKCEGFNFAGSGKLKAASEMISAAEHSGLLDHSSVLIESSSGNMGVALSMIAASRGYTFVCVTDPRCNLTTKRLMESLGSQVHTITEPDDDGGFLGARLSYIRTLCASDDRYLWLDQYRNPNNWQAHYRRTAPAISRRFPELDVLFVGAGTTGTLMGCARWFGEFAPQVRVVAVDSVGSVTFGGPPGRRMIPGLGTSERQVQVDESYLCDVVYVSEPDTVRMCHRLAKKGFLFGGSTGTVCSGALQWLQVHDPGHHLSSVAVSPDLGERYLDTVYQESWVRDVYGDDVLAGDRREPVG
ncbi:2,3-diaminopropionate biosynthesis protein SbnA [Streptosporangium sp. NBC_01755]|uniref:2,3-diaminopropionate biosynthesis protein SbnA n=1 Tax=unclassified Streptosporangium TaxID=2632669 RepID=UPI002DD80D5A|nr:MULTISPECIES: 2,3-diaminopropionate biosynthesis protein SbnA [unclassified Streptosporangium]WSA28005.1 2,3-diaminopropionate biosynthesis protein SbnA [Streptosporangium sp. NBC_01810]WSA28146.1 2,3-diaminopropionate biosynthesis protein SbnA [Streptosporangium sp. NBC_01810]WSD00379.1 2,3-diaminopropionate biosynthesis protein SbnA [Streptosporangium sp. NBC_01755]WSD00524.1 2,3-diaminopropionate biosynthesis protein SbnA [Streptosporangium sp. NBC_01755]